MSASLLLPGGERVTIGVQYVPSPQFTHLQVSLAIQGSGFHLERREVQIRSCSEVLAVLKLTATLPHPFYLSFPSARMTSTCCGTWQAGGPHEGEGGNVTTKWAPSEWRPNIPWCTGWPPNKGLSSLGVLCTTVVGGSSDPRVSGHFPDSGVALAS